MAASTNKPKPKLGSGARFKALKKKVGSAALAAHIGRKHHGKKKLAAMSAAGRKRSSSRKGRKA